MAWKFLSIGKANAEIDRLNKELEAAKTAAATPPPPVNPPAAEAPKTEDPDGDGDAHMECEACNGTGTCAECMGNGKCAECSGEGKTESAGAEARTPKSKSGKLAAKLDDLGTQLEAANKQISSLTATVAAKDAEIAELNKKAESQSEEVRVQVARQVVTAQAALGQPAVPSVPATATGNTNGELKGMARIRAGIKSELDKNIPPMFPPRN